MKRTHCFLLKTVSFVAHLPSTWLLSHTNSFLSVGKPHCLLSESNFLRSIVCIHAIHDVGNIHETCDKIQKERLPEIILLSVMTIKCIIHHYTGHQSKTVWFQAS